MKAQKHILPSFGDRLVNSVASDDIYDFIEIKKKEGLSNRYVSDIIILMKSVFKYAVRTYHIFNPMEGVSLPKKKTPEIQLLNVSEQQNLQQYLSKNQNRRTLRLAVERC